jgi:polyisoprenoid-binding protein YceI
LYIHSLSYGEAHGSIRFAIDQPLHRKRDTRMIDRLLTVYHFVFMKTFFIILLLFFVSCSPKQPKCEFSFNQEKTSIQWTAYKFTKMVGVKGTFNGFTVTGAKNSDTIEGAVKDIQFQIRTETVSTNNPERDPKIKDFFFGKFQNGLISGSFKEIAAGKATLSLSMNGVSKDVPVTYSITDNQKLKVNSKINVLDWNAKDSLDALNAVCSEQHKDTDGLSKLWPDVDIEIQSEFSTTCK